MTTDDETSRPTVDGEPRRGHDYRVGVFSAAAVIVAATVGTLASAPGPTGSEGPAPVQVNTIEPVWSDGLDHVVVMAEHAVQGVVRSPASPEPVTVDPSLLPETSGGAVLPPDDVVRAALEAVPGVVTVEVVAPGTFAVATAGSRDDLLAVPGVSELHDDLLFAPTTDPDEGRQWALRNTGAPAQASGWPGVAGADADVVPAWDVSEGAGIVVAVVDTGVDPTHPDLAGRLWANNDEVCANGLDDDRNGFVDDCRGWDFGMGDNDPTDDRGRPASDHGTHVAGIVAAGRNGVGIVGVAPQATIMPVKVSRSSDGLFPGSAIYSGIVYAVDNGAQVINMSFGTSPGVSRASASLQERAIQYAVERGVTLVAAAGNSAVDIGVTPVWPAGFSQYYPGVVTVGATTNSDAKASFSNFGTPVTIWAPGQMLLSTLPGGLQGFKSGTSMAAPVVAGAVASVLAAGKASTPAEIRARFTSTARPGPAGPYLDVAEAVGTVTARPASVVYEPAQTLTADTTGTIGVRITAPGLAPGVTAARVSLATTDAGVVYAVEGLPVRITTPDQGQLAMSSGIDGALAAVPLGPTTQVGPGDWRFELSTALPAGSYAVVTELVDLAGTPRGGAFVGFVQVGTAPTPGPTPGPIVTSPVTTSPIVTSPVPTSPGTTSPVPVTTSPGLTSPTLPPPAPPAPTVPAPVPTAPGTSTPTATLPPVPAPTTTLVAPGPTWPVPTTTVPPMAPTIPPPVTSLPTLPPVLPPPPVVTSPPPSDPPVPTVPPTTTPMPDPDTSGSWRLDSMTPRLASTAGGVSLDLFGRFPTTVPVYVWFGDLAVVEAVNTGTRLTVASPPVARTGVVDVVVRFTTAQSHVLVLADAFTFVAPATAPPNPVSPSPEAPGTTAPVQPAPPTTIGLPPTPTVPAPTSTVAAPTPAPTTPITPPITPPITTVVQPAPSTTEVVLTRGQVRLRSQPTSGALSRLSAVAWPGAGCTSTSCPTTSL